MTELLRNDVVLLRAGQNANRVLHVDLCEITPVSEETGRWSWMDSNPFARSIFPTASHPAKLRQTATMPRMNNKQRFMQPGEHPGTARSIHSWRRSICEGKDPRHSRFTPDQSGGLLAETGRRGSGVERTGSSAVEELEMCLGAQDPDCCNGRFEGTRRADDQGLS